VPPVGCMALTTLKGVVFAKRPEVSAIATPGSTSHGVRGPGCHVRLGWFGRTVTLSQYRGLARFGRIDRSVERSPCARRCRRTEARKVRSKAKPDKVVQTPAARLSGRATSCATNAYAIHASTPRVASRIPAQSGDTSGWSSARFISTGAAVRGTPAQPGRGCPGRDRERDSGRITRSDVAHRDAAVLNGSDRIHSHGGPPRRMTPNGCLVGPVIVVLRSWQRLAHGGRTEARTIRRDGRCREETSTHTAFQLGHP
jgi:hypothetical protein